MNEWSMMWGAKVKLRNDMPDDMLKDAIMTSRRVLDACVDFESDGLACAEKIKTEFDTRYVSSFTSTVNSLPTLIAIVL